MEAAHALSPPTIYQHVMLVKVGERKKVGNKVGLDLGKKDVCVCVRASCFSDPDEGAKKRHVPPLSGPLPAHYREYDLWWRRGGEWGVHSQDAMPPVSIPIY